MIRAVVFDFDGVIANSEPLHFRAFSDVLAARGIALSERDYYERFLGFDDVGAFEAIGAHAKITLTARDVADLCANKALRLEELERERSVLFPGAKDAIGRMAAHGPIAIASGALRPEIVRVLEHEHLASFFSAIVAAEDTRRSKPAPDPYVRAVELLSGVTAGLRPDECAAVEDSRWGIQSAKAAGLRTIAVAHTYPADALAEADRVVDNLAGLTRALLSTFGPGS